MAKTKTLEKVNTLPHDSNYKSNLTAKDFYGFLKDIKVSDEELDQALEEAKHMWDHHTHQK